MQRQSLTDGSGSWFDLDAAKVYEEDTWWNGSNRVSHATGDKFEHERLYLTASGCWILNHWSQWQGSHESFMKISAEEASAWVVRNNEDPDSVGLAEFAAAAEL